MGENLINAGLRNESCRNEWLEKVLQDIPSGSRILDAGAGELKYESLCSHLNYVSQDFAQYDGMGDGAGLQMGTWNQTRLDIISDITAIPEANGSFDAIMCIEVFEHLPNPIAAIKEFSRLLRPGGLLILTAPFCSLTHFAPYHYYSGFNRYFYLYHLVSNGFEIQELVPNGNFFEYLAQEIRRVSAVTKQYTNRRLGIFGQIVLRLVLPILGRLSAIDNGSHQLLCFGYHVRASKATIP